MRVQTVVHRMRMEKWLTACLSSRTLAQYSTDRYAGGLYCRVRNGTGCDSAAVAVMPIQGISDKYITFVDSGLLEAGLPWKIGEALFFGVQKWFDSKQRGP